MDGWKDRTGEKKRMEKEWKDEEIWNEGREERRKGMMERRKKYE